MLCVLQVTAARSELEKLKREHEQVKAELSKVCFLVCTLCLAPRAIIL